MTDETTPTSSDPLPRISMDEEKTDLMDAEQLRARSTPLPGGWSTSSSTPPSTKPQNRTAMDNKSEPDMQPPHRDDNVIPTDPPPPPPKKLWRIPVIMLLTGVLFWRIWPWVAPYFGR